MVKIDKSNRQIIDILRENAKCPAKEIAARTAMPITTVFNRIKKLEREGVIKRYSIVVDEKKLGKNIAAYVLLHYNIALWGESVTRESLKKQLLELPCIVEVKYLLGQYDILLKVQVADIEELNDIILDRFRKIPGIGQTATLIVLEDLM